MRMVCDPARYGGQSQGKWLIAHHVTLAAGDSLASFPCKSPGTRAVTDVHNVLNTTFCLVPFWAPGCHCPSTPHYVKVGSTIVYWAKHSLCNRPCLTASGKSCPPPSTSSSHPLTCCWCVSVSRTYGSLPPVPVRCWVGMLLGSFLAGGGEMIQMP